MWRQVMIKKEAQCFYLPLSLSLSLSLSVPHSRSSILLKEKTFFKPFFFNCLNFCQLWWKIHRKVEIFTFEEKFAAWPRNGRKKTVAYFFVKKRKEIISHRKHCIQMKSKKVFKRLIHSVVRRFERRCRRRRWRWRRSDNVVVYGVDIGDEWLRFQAT